MSASVAVHGAGISSAEPHNGAVLATHAGFDVIDCLRCGYAHVAPMPDARSLRDVYRHDYYAADKPLYLQRYEEDRAWWMDVYADRLATIERELPDDARRMLEIGSGPGLFLDASAARGWRVTGIEPASQAAAHARGLGHDVREGFFSAGTAAQFGPVDAIHMALVLEHVPDPAALLAAARSLLPAHGVLCVVVPNDFNPLQAAAIDQDVGPYWVAPPHHLNYFTPASLSGLLARSGFAIVRQTTTFPIEMFLLMGERYVGNDALGRICHGKRKAFETAMRASGQGDRLARLYESLAAQDLGREIVLFARPAADWTA